MFQYCTAILSADERTSDWDCAWWDMGGLDFANVPRSDLSALQFLAQKSCQNQDNVFRIGQNGDRRAIMASTAISSVNEWPPCMHIIGYAYAAR